MIKAVIVEDELIQIEYLKNLLQDFCPNVKVIKTIHSASEFIPQLSNLSFDLLFLDIKLGDKNSLELLEQLPKIDFQIIVVSAYEQFAIKAIKSHVVDYLIKPFLEEELFLALRKVIEKIKSQKRNVLNANLRLPKENHCICISEYDSYTFIPCHDILYCRSEGNYTQLFFINEEGKRDKIVSSKNLFHFEQKFCSNHFIRIHQSFLVNKSKIRKIQKRSRDLILSDGTVLEIARDRKNAVLSLLIQ